MDPPGRTYDVFLSYNTRDHHAVERIGRWLKDRSLTCFMDRWYLVPGTPWPVALEQAGGILNQGGNLTLSADVLSQNVASGSTTTAGRGGGLRSLAGTLTVTGCTITGNQALGGTSSVGDGLGGRGNAKIKFRHAGDICRRRRESSLSCSVRASAVASRFACSPVSMSGRSRRAGISSQ